MKYESAFEWEPSRASKRAALQEQIKFYEAVIDDAEQTLARLENDLKALNPIVKVVYETPRQVSLRTAESFDYIDGTDEGLKLGQRVIAPTRYNKAQVGIVVEIEAKRSYFGRLNEILTVLP